MQHSFQLIKETLAVVATLTHPDPAADLSPAVDASNTYIGAVLPAVAARRQRLEAIILLQQEAGHRPAEVLSF